MEYTIDEGYIKVLRLKLTLKFASFTVTTPIMITIMLWIIDFGILDLPLEFQIVFYILLGLIIIIPILCFTVASIWAVKWFENYSYELEDTGIRINSGVITKRQKFIPYNKIQHLELVRGFIERRYGLSTIQIETAGYMGVQRGAFYRPEGEIPGLRDPDPIMEEIRVLMGKPS